DRLVETVDALEDAGYMSMSLAESDPDPKNKAVFLANAIRAYSEAAKLRLKLGVSKDLLDMLRAGMKGDDEAPDPNERIDYIEWVYTNRIAPKLEEPEDTELIQPAAPSSAPVENETDNGNDNRDYSARRLFPKNVGTRHTNERGD